MSMPLTIHVRKCGKAVELDFMALPENVRRYIIEYGARQIFNDCHSAEKDPAEAWKLVEKKRTALEAGVVKAARTAANPFEKWAMDRLAYIVQAQVGGTKKDAMDTVKQSGGTLTERLAKLFKSEEAGEAAEAKLRAQFDKEQKAAAAMQDALGDISL